MIKIRLRRTGTKKKASYRVVIAHSTAPRDGRFIENIGYYQPREDPPVVVVKEDRLFYWLSVGAQPTDSVKRILANQSGLDQYAQFKTGAVSTAAPAPEAEAAVEAADETEDTEAASLEAPAAEVVEDDDSAPETPAVEAAE